MKVVVLPDADAVARRGAAFIAGLARAASDARGRFVVAVSGGNTPWCMLRSLAREKIPWNHVHIVQADERVAPADSPDRNLTHLRESLLDRVPLDPNQIHPMPVEDAQLTAAAARYAQVLEQIAESPPVLDLIQLGLGADGHTASLIPGDPVIGIRDADVAVTGVYEGRRRMTLTYPLIDRARCILWIVTGAAKSEVLTRFRSGDAELPASRVSRDRAVVLADRAAAGSGN